MPHYAFGSEVSGSGIQADLDATGPAVVRSLGSVASTNGVAIRSAGNYHYVLVQGTVAKQTACRPQSLLSLYVNLH